MEISKVLRLLPKEKPAVYDRLYLDAIRRKDKKNEIQQQQEKPRKNTNDSDVFERLYSKRKQPETPRKPETSRKLETPRKPETPRKIETPRRIETPRIFNPEVIEKLAKPKKIPERIEEPLPPTKKCDGKVFDRLYNDAKRLQENKNKIEAAKLYILEERRIREMNIIREPETKKDSKSELPITWIKDSVNFMTMTARGELYDINKGIGVSDIKFVPKKDIYVGITNEEYTKLMEIVKTNKNPEEILELKLKELKVKQEKEKMNLEKSFRFPNKIELLNLLKKKK